MDGHARDMMRTWEAGGGYDVAADGWRDKGNRLSQSARVDLAGPMRHDTDMAGLACTQGAKEELSPHPRAPFTARMHLYKWGMALSRRINCQARNAERAGTAADRVQLRATKIRSKGTNGGTIAVSDSPRSSTNRCPASRLQQRRQQSHRRSLALRYVGVWTPVWEAV